MAAVGVLPDLLLSARGGYATAMERAPKPIYAAPGVHWAARPLPPPVQNHHPLRPDEDRLDALLEQWVEELRFGNTVDAD